jgi:hypothetical protein
MSKYWFQNPFILFENIEQFFPQQGYTREEKINSIARLSLYYAFILIAFKMDTKYLSLAFALLLLSLFLGSTEKFQELKANKCTRPTKDNPYSNFTVGDHMTDPYRSPACPMDIVRQEQIDNFRFNVFPDVGDLYGKTITDRNFYTMPSTTVVNDQEGFANFLYGDFGKCKSEGIDCLKNRDNRFHRGRYYYQY